MCDPIHLSVKISVSAKPFAAWHYLSQAFSKGNSCSLIYTDKTRKKHCISTLFV